MSLFWTILRYYKYFDYTKIYNNHHMIYQNDFGDISPASTHASNDETHDVILIDHSAQFLNVCCWMQLLANIRVYG